MRGEIRSKVRPRNSALIGAVNPGLFSRRANFRCDRRCNRSTAGFGARPRWCARVRGRSIATGFAGQAARLAVCRNRNGKSTLHFPRSSKISPGHRPQDTLTGFASRQRLSAAERGHFSRGFSISRNEESGANRRARKWRAWLFPISASGKHCSADQSRASRSAACRNRA